MKTRILKKTSMALALAGTLAGASAGNALADEDPAAQGRSYVNEEGNTVQLRRKTHTNEEGDVLVRQGYRVTDENGDLVSRGGSAGRNNSDGSKVRKTQRQYTDQQGRQTQARNRVRVDANGNRQANRVVRKK